MAKSVDWYYHRKGCTTCGKSQGFMEDHDVKVKELVDAKARLGRGDALTLARAAGKVIVAKGKKVVAFDMKKDDPDDATLLAHMLGPTGNLRAPTVRRGKTVFVGFNEDEYTKLLG